MLVEFLDCRLGSWRLGQRPSRHVLLIAWVSRGLGHVTAGAHGARSRGLALQASLSAPVAESVLWLLLDFGACFDEVLRSGVSVVVDSVLHAGFSSNFGGTDAGSAAIVGYDGVIEEECVLVVVVLGLAGVEASGLTESLSWSLQRFERLLDQFKSYLFVLDTVLVLVDGSWRALRDVFLDGELAQEHLGLVVALGLAERVVGLGLFVGEGKLTEGGVGLLTVQLVRQLGQL